MTRSNSNNNNNNSNISIAAHRRQTEWVRENLRYFYDKKSIFLCSYFVALKMRNLRAFQSFKWIISIYNYYPYLINCAVSC
jgi:hypothetical protein